MKFTRLHTIPTKFFSEAKKTVGIDFEDFCAGIDEGFIHLYLVDNNTLYAIYPRKNSIEVVLIIGENLKQVTTHVIEYCRNFDIKYITAHTEKRGVERMFKSLGGVHTATIKQYTLEI